MKHFLNTCLFCPFLASAVFCINHCTTWFYTFKKLNRKINWQGTDSCIIKCPTTSDCIWNSHFFLNVDLSIYYLVHFKLFVLSFFWIEHMTTFPASCAECCSSQLQTPQLSIPVQQEALEATVLVLIGEKRSIKWVDGKQMVIYPLWLQFKSNTLNFVYSSNFFSFLFFFPAHLPQKLDRERFCPSLGGTTLSTMVVWMWGGGDRWVQPYLQRSSCVESRTFFLFLLLPWWCGLFWWVLLLEELCCPWLPLFWWDRDVLACREGNQAKNVL